MYLKSLELAGFKSFAKKTELLFSTPVTAIVGPNGSGKSNIAEAFRFVLGEQSIKSMRGKRTEDLIFNGSKEVGRLNRASVKVVFDNRTKLLNLDFDEVAIERVIYRDSSSEYRINGSQVRLRDVIELLSSAHIGASGHHIISQGEADKILNASPSLRREMIEDALGLKVYQYKKEESGRKLEKTEENIRSVGSLRREIAPHLAFLKKQVEKIERTAELKNELSRLAREYLKREDIYLAHGLEAIERERKGPKEELARLERELAEAKDVLARSENRDAKSGELLDLEGKLSAVRESKDALSRELGRIEGAIGSEERAKERAEKREGSLPGASVPLAEVESVSAETEKKFAESGPESSAEFWKQAFESVKRSLFSLVARYRVKESAAAGEEFAAALGRLKKEKEEVEGKLRGAVSEEAKLNRSYADLKAGIEKEKDSGREAERAVFRIMASGNEVRTALQALAAREEKIAFLRDEFKRELGEAAVLIGREVAAYGSFQVAGEGGEPLSAEAVLAEDRGAQEERKRKIARLKVRIEDAGAGGGEEVMKEYQETAAREEFLAREIADLEKSAASLRELIAELESRLDSEFRAGVERINGEFGKFFGLMFGGGSAALVVAREKVRRAAADDEALLFAAEADGDGAADGEDGREGIEIEIALPRKKIKGLMMLSGGERALASIALLFAMSRVNPPPFVILDETDAALDEANSKKYGDMIAELSRLSQLILITHNRETMSRAGVLYGVTMGSGGLSRLLSIQFEEAVAVAK